MVRMVQLDYKILLNLEVYTFGDRGLCTPIL